MSLWGHDAEVVVARFSPSQHKIATGSMDATAKVFHISSGRYRKNQTSLKRISYNLIIKFIDIINCIYKLELFLYFTKIILCDINNIVSNTV